MPLVEAMRFDHPPITRPAEKYAKGPAQILLRYSLQKVCEALWAGPSECRSSVVIYTADAAAAGTRPSTPNHITLETDHIKHADIRFRVVERGGWNFGSP